MKTSIKSNRTIVIGKVNNNTSDWKYCIMRIWVNAILAISAFEAFTSGFNIPNSKVTVVALGFAASMLLQFIMFWSFDKKKRWTILFGLSLIFGGTAVAAVYFEALSNGISSITNDILTTVNKNKAMANLMFIVDEDNAVQDKKIALNALILLLVIVIGILVYFRRYIILSLSMIFILSAGMIWESDGNAFWTLIGIVGVCSAIFFANIKGRLYGSFIFEYLATMILLASVSVGVLYFMGYDPLMEIDELKDEIVYEGTNLMYGKSDYPEGKFSRFEMSMDEENNRLTVSSDKYVKMYLRGYVGSKYTPSGWEDNDQEIYGNDYEGVFEWFYQNQYYPLTSVAQYIESSQKANMINVSIENTSASIRYQYLPENITFDSLNGLYSAKKDVNFRAQGFGSKKPYDFAIESVDSYETIADAEWFLKETGPKEFLDCEQVYHYFSNQNYSTIPDEMRAYFQNKLPSAGNEVFSTAKLIRKYLAKEITYNEYVEAYEGDEDFVQHLLETSKEGYSPHYATLATLMFRYYGIPARYVEGYIAESEDKELTYNVTNKDAHAWVEVYQRGIGFIPIEVTPGFYEENDIGGGSQGGGGGGSSSGGAELPQDEDQNPNDPSETRDYSIVKILVILGMTLVVTIVFFLIRRIIVIKMRRKRISSTDFKCVIETAGVYQEKMIKYKKLEFVSTIPVSMKQIYERYKFGGIMPNDEEIESIKGYTDVVVKELKESTNFLQHIVLKFWYCYF
ncbi:MAG: transglutaminase-like domain-containing protein [Agathobacter sp.]|nr:transglutaminase-like domain-containing protein [Agathobacter sp.]